MKGQIEDKTLHTVAGVKTLQLYNCYDYEEFYFDRVGHSMDRYYVLLDKHPKVDIFCNKRLLINFCMAVGCTYIYWNEGAQKVYHIGNLNDYGTTWY